MSTEITYPLELDIVVPVYNESDNIISFLLALKNAIQKTSFRVLICYDFDEDTTLSAIHNNSTLFEAMHIEFIRNRGHGPHDAVLSGFQSSRAQAVLVMPADDFQNARIIDNMVNKLQNGVAIVCASRLMSGGTMHHCPLLKNILVRCASYTLYYLAGLPTHDASNGFRMFSKALLDEVMIESKAGFTYSIELLVKAHRLQKPIVEIPANWIERDNGVSRFKLLKWIFPYLRWYFYAFETTYFRRFLKTAGYSDAKKI